MNSLKPYFVYVIQSDCGKHYIGLSENVDRRLSDHNKGRSKWTSRYNNWIVIYKKKFKDLTDARIWENYLKKQKGGNGLKKIIAG